MNADRRIVIDFALLEGLHLTQLVEDFHDLIGTDRDLSDPAVQRITPSAYPDDRSASRDFAASTRDDLLERRMLDADTVRQALTPFRTEDPPVTEDAALAPISVTITGIDVDAWMRTLTAIRLVIAERLEITDDTAHSSDDDRFGIYDWLGYRLELIVQAADELDERAAEEL